MKTKDKVLELVDFMKQKKREACRVCQLDEKIRAQLSAARAKKIPQAVRLEWLRVEVGVEVNRSELQSHYAGGHEDP